MKRLMLLNLVLVLTLGFWTVGTARATDIGVAWVGESGMANRVTAGFEKGLKNLMPDAKVEYQKNLDSLDNLATIVARWQSEKQAMVILRSNGAEWLSKHAPTIPTFIGACSHPVYLGVVKSLEAPGGNITGVTYYLPLKTQFEIFQAIVPNMKSVCLIMEKGHPGMPIDQDGTQKICAELGIEYSEILATTKDEAESAVAAKAGQVSAFIIGNQALISDNAERLVAAAKDTPVVSYAEKSVRDGALGGFVADDEKLGGFLADMVAEVLLKGKAPGEIPIQVDPDPKFFLNAKTAKRLNLEIPYSILGAATVIE